MDSKYIPCPNFRYIIFPSNSDFLARRQDNLLYMDKTAQIVDFLAADQFQLFTRPRRFGKSLLLSTIEAMYSGNPDLFRGDGIRPELAVYRDGKWDWPQYIVLHLNMLTLEPWEGSLNPALNGLVAWAASALQMRSRYEHSSESPAQSLINLVTALGQQSQETLGTARVVVLVDEYDAPILNQMHSPRRRIVRRELANFYGAFEFLDSRIERLVLTGVTRFVKTGLWSGLNQVRDRSENPRFHDLTGFTDTELDALWNQVQDHVPTYSSRPGWPSLSRTAWREWMGTGFPQTQGQPCTTPLPSCAVWTRGS